VGRGIGILVAVAAVVLAVVAISGGGESHPHRLTVTLPDATNVVAGQKIRVAGSPVGEVESVKAVRRGHAVRLGLRLGDAAWPLGLGSRMQLRWGGTVSFSNRYIALSPARGTARSYREGAAFDAADFSVPVEFDSVLRMFGARTRSDLADMLRQSGQALQPAEPELRRALDVAPDALTQAGHVLRDLDDQRAALGRAVRSGDEVLAAVNAADPGTKQLLTATGRTLDAVADQADDLREGIANMPHTFANVRDTLRRADPTLDAVRRLAARLGPGITSVHRAAVPLAGVLRTVRRVAPDATGTLRSLRGASPDLTRLLDKLGALSPSLRSIGKQSVDNLECIRPYTPDIVSFFTDWGDFFSNPDGKDEMIRATVQQFLPGPTNADAKTPAEAKKLFPGLEYGFPRPPGTNAGQPWFLPECGAGPDALDPAKDPEARVRPATLPPLTALVPFGKAGR
jgi:ABC-type transporter Mla subunit MlaD